VHQNVASLVSPPRVVSTEIGIVRADHLAGLLKRLRGEPIYPIASLALASGMRRGELLALRWQDVDFDRALLRVEQSLETTKAGLRFKAPKTRHGRRTITLPATIVADLRTRWREQQEQRLALGLGKAPGEALVFSTWEGRPLDPRGVTKAWARAMALLGSAKVTLHSLRHTHASQLIAAGVDVLTVSRRLGHGSPTITLGVYGHLFSNSDDRAASIIEATFAASRTE
jgi:integrase